MRSAVLFILLAASTVAFAQTGLATATGSTFGASAPARARAASLCEFFRASGSMRPGEPAPPAALTCMNVFGQIIPCPQ